MLYSLEAPTDLGSEKIEKIPHDGVTLLRAVVCLSIVAMHFYPPVIDAWFIKHRLLVQPGQLVTHVRLGFESFFLLSGYFLAHCFRSSTQTSFSVLAFFRRRFLRLAIPFWVALWCVGFAGYWLSSLASHQRIPVQCKNLWLQMFFVQDVLPYGDSGGAFWFMAPLMQFYLLWGLVFWLLRRFFLARQQRRYHLFAIRWMTVLSSFLFFVSACLSAERASFRWALPGNAHFLILGGAACWYCEKRVTLRCMAAMLLVEAAVGFFSGTSRPFCAVITCVLLIVGTGQVYLAPASVAWLLCVGRWSYSIYLTHMFVGFRVINSINNHSSNVASLLTALLTWVAAVVAAVCFGAIFYVLVERPCKDFSSRVAYRF